MGRNIYNGVELPSLPEWDKKVYPYAYITKSFTWVLWLSSKPVYSNNGQLITSAALNILRWYCRIDTTDDWYGPDGPDEYAEGAGCGGHPIWTNTDIINTDGSVYLAASDPVPVGGEPEPTTAPADLYKIKNGVGQTHDVYKRVGDQWVPLDEYNT